MCYEIIKLWTFKKYDAWMNVCYKVVFCCIVLHWVTSVTVRCSLEGHCVSYSPSPGESVDQHSSAEELHRHKWQHDKYIWRTDDLSSNTFIIWPTLLFGSLRLTRSTLSGVVASAAAASASKMRGQGDCLLFPPLSPGPQPYSSC